MSSNYATNRTSDYIEFNNPQTASEAQRQSQVVESFDVLEKSIEALKENCISLEKRLDPVLRHGPEAMQTSAKDAPPMVVSLAQRINDSSNKIHTLNNQLNSILQRLEL